MAHTHPAPSDKLAALRKTSASTEEHSRWHGRHASNKENVLAHGADPLGLADSTAAFTAAELAAGEGGKLIVPKGTYLLDNWTPVTNSITVLGEGIDTLLRTKTANSFAMTLEGVRTWTLKELTFDGEVNLVVKTGNGLRVRGANSGSASSSQHHSFERIRFRQCLTGLTIAQGAVTTQVDKNFFWACQFTDNTTGISINSVNAQQQLFFGFSVQSCTTGVKCTEGTATFISGQFQSCTTSMLIDGAFIWLNLVDVITEGSTTDISGSAGNWPGQGVDATQCIFQAATNNVSMTSGGVLRTRHCKFNTGALAMSGNDSVWHDDYTQLAFGAAYTPTGTNNRRVKTDSNGLTVIGGAAGTTTLFSQNNALGDLKHGGTTAKLGLFGATPVSRTAAYTPTNVTPDRSYDANATTTDELADVLGTLIADLQSYGLLQ